MGPTGRVTGPHSRWSGRPRFRADDRRVGLHDEIGVVVGQPPTDAFGIPRGAFERISMLIQPRRVRSSQRPSRTRVTAAGGSSRTMAAPNGPTTRSDTVRPSGRAMPVATMTSSGESSARRVAERLDPSRRRSGREAVRPSRTNGRRHQRDGPDEDARRGRPTFKRPAGTTVWSTGWRTPCRRARCRRRLGSCRGPCRRARAPGRAGGDGWRTSMPAMLDRMHRLVDGRMGDGSPAGGTTSRTGPHRTRPARRAIVAATHRARWRRSAVANRTPRTIAGPLAPTASSLVGCIVPARHPGRPSRTLTGGRGTVRIAASIAAFLLVLAAVAPAGGRGPDATLRRRGLAAILATATIVVTVSYRIAKARRPTGYVKIAGRPWRGDARLGLKRGVTFGGRASYRSGRTRSRCPH